MEEHFVWILKTEDDGSVWIQPLWNFPGARIMRVEESLLKRAATDIAYVEHSIFE